ncbi:MAG TPA: hypothetical protein VN408_06920 [Actinoplanes sp.]|nr:hypothetical protein [Actinoplanes sp.]
MTTTGSLYLFIAGIALCLAVNALRTALAPVSEIIRAAGAFALAGLAVGAALVFALAAVVTGF